MCSSQSNLLLKRHINLPPTSFSGTLWILFTCNSRGGDMSGVWTIGPAHPWLQKYMKQLPRRRATPAQPITPPFQLAIITEMVTNAASSLFMKCKKERTKTHGLFRAVGQLLKAFQLVVQDWFQVSLQVIQAPAKRTGPNGLNMCPAHVSWKKSETT